MAKYTETPIIIKSNGLRLSGVFHKPSRLNKFPAVVFCHGYFQSNKIGPFALYVQIARDLCAKGIACLRFDCAGFGESEGKYLDVSYESLCTDLQNALTKLMKIKGVNCKKIGIIGHSLGGNIALQVALSNNSVKGLCLLSPNTADSSENIKIFDKIQLDELYTTGTTFRGGIPASIKVYKPIHEGISQKNARLLETSTMLIFGEKDRYYSHQQYKRFSNSFSKAISIKKISKADHNFLPTDSWNELIPQIVLWFSDIFLSTKKAKLGD
jgi:uncharacterized protein